MLISVKIIGGGYFDFIIFAEKSKNDENVMMKNLDDIYMRITYV